MEIKKEIYDSHRRLSACSTNFLDFVKENPRICQRSHFNSMISDKRFGYFQSQPWPTFIDQKMKKKMAETTIDVYRLITSIPDRFFSHNVKQMSTYYEIQEDLLKILIYGVDNEFLNSILGRGDFILSTAGQLKCIEFNMQANLGGWELDQLEPLYVNVPLISQFLSKYNVRLHPNGFFSTLMEHVVQRFLDKQPPLKEKEINVVMAYHNVTEVFDKSGLVQLTNVFKTILQQEVPGVKGDLMICEFNDLKVVKRRLFYGPKKIDILIEMRNGKVPFPYLMALKEGNLMMYNGPITQVMSNKLNLALLSENIDSDLFSPTERQIIETCIPWTRKVKPGETTYKNKKVQLEDFIVSHRELLVLKPGEGLCGIDVYPGHTTSADLWNQKVKQALEEKNWVIQEYVPSMPFLYQIGESGCTPHHAIWGLFALGPRYAGGFVRILPGTHNKGVINSHQGAEESIILEVEE